MEKRKTLVGLKKAQSLLGKIIKMIEEDRYCIDIMQQNLAIIGLLKSVHQQLMENHLRSCFTNAVLARSKKKKTEMIEEILKVTRLANR